MKNKIELIPVNEFGSEITVGGYGFDKFIEKPKQLTDLEIAIKLEEIEREETKQKTVEEVMTPKEKAEELVNLYLKNKRLTFALNKFKAKECALIAVHELIKEGFFTDGYYNRCAFWDEVKQEIEKL